jgi:putative DNA primase/helicase
MIDFEGVNTAALRRARSLLPNLIPGGAFRSLEYVVKNPCRNDQRPGSFSINYKSGRWKDFASNDGGSDLISLVAYLRGSSQGDAARELADKLGVPALKPNSVTGNANTTGKIKANGHGQEIQQPVSPRIPEGDDNGPPAGRPELRRHMYPDGVRLKIKFANGEPL